MKRSSVMTKVIPLAEAKKQLSAIVKDADEKFDRFAITKNGVSKAIIMSSDEYEGLLETLDILSREEERESIARAKAQVRKGKTVSLDHVKKKYDVS
jgi:prevent-host-death family protein